MASSRSCFTWLPAVLLAMAIPAMLIIREGPLYANRIDDDNQSETNLDFTYNIQDVHAPAFAGPILPVASYLVARAFLAPFIIRHLLRTNGFDDVSRLVYYLVGVVDLEQFGQRVGVRL